MELLILAAVVYLLSRRPSGAPEELAMLQPVGQGVPLLPTAPSEFDPERSIAERDFTTGADTTGTGAIGSAPAAGSVDLIGGLRGIFDFVGRLAGIAAPAVPGAAPVAGIAVALGRLANAVLGPPTMGPVITGELAASTDPVRAATEQVARESLAAGSIDIGNIGSIERLATGQERITVQTVSGVREITLEPIDWGGADFSAPTSDGADYYGGVEYQGSPYGY